MTLCDCLARGICPLVEDETLEKRAAGADPSCRIVTEPSHLARVGCVNGNITLTTDEMTRLRVVDHDDFKHQIAVGCFLSVSEEAGCGFRVYQFWVKACHIWGEQRRSFHSQVPGFRPKTRPISVPVVSRTSLSKLNLVWRRRIGINGEVPIVHAVTRGTAENGQAEARSARYKASAFRAR